MKIRHKIISMITAIIFLAGMFSVIPLTAVAYGTYGSLTYNTYDSDGDGVYDYLTIANCDESVTEVEIPAEIDGVPVTEIQQYAFGGCNNLKNVIIPDSVVRIDKYAFYGCRSLKEITIPESVASIGEGAFCLCTLLEKIKIKNPECEIFDNEITITHNNKSESYFSFNGTIYGSQNSTAQAYAEKYERKFALLGSDQTDTFENFTYIILDSDYDGVNDCIEITDCDHSATVINVPAEINGVPVKSIGNNAFYKYTELTDITLPAGITSIGNYAFWFCTNLENINIPSNVKKIGEEAFYKCYKLTEIEIPNSVTEICDGAFLSCEGLTEIEIPDSVKYIGNSSFHTCDNLAEITLSDGITSIGHYTFHQCERLMDIKIPETVVSIGNGAFWNCFGLTNITIPSSVASIDNCAFKNCSVLETVLIKNPECEIYDSADTIFNNLIFDEETGEVFNCFNGTIYGYENSTAQAYAEKYGYNFKLFVQGDISKNDLIDLYDAIEVVKYIMKIRTFTETDKQFADFTGNGVVDLYDAIEIARTLI
jgi:hypothetical protein